MTIRPEDYPALMLTETQKWDRAFLNMLGVSILGFNEKDRKEAALSKAFDAMGLGLNEVLKIPPLNSPLYDLNRLPRLIKKMEELGVRSDVIGRSARSALNKIAEILGQGGVKQLELAIEELKDLFEQEKGLKYE